MWWEVITEALLDTLKLFPFLLLLYILIELMEHNTKIGKANGALCGKAAPAIGAATGLVPMCGFSVMAAKLYRHRHLTLGTLLAVFIATSDEAFIVLLLAEMNWADKLLSVLALCGSKLVLGIGIGYLADILVRKRPALVPLVNECAEEHKHEHAHEHENDENAPHMHHDAHEEHDHDHEH
ncbi:MAG: arsenic efflux protein, partial [Clostridia bacterium]|nr:arsenic efflux protein [Clostridia bacterium]